MLCRGRHEGASHRPLLPPGGDCAPHVACQTAPSRPGAAIRAGQALTPRLSRPTQPATPTADRDDGPVRPRSDRRPGDAAPLPSETGNPGTRVARRNRFRSKDPLMTPTPGDGPLRAGRRLVEIELQLPADPAAAGGDRVARLLLLHPSPAAQGAGGPRRPRARATRSATRCRPSAASSAPFSRSTATATRS